MKRFRAIEAHWDENCAILKDTVEKGKRLLPVMEKLGMPVRPADLGFDGAQVRETFIVSRDVRDKYLLSSLIFDLGLTDEFAAYLEKEYGESPGDTEASS